MGYGLSNLRSHRSILGISQSRLARVSRVSRFKICLFELGDGSLTAAEQEQIRHALLAEAERIRGIAIEIDLGQPSSEELATP
jgi:predicted transcriptional regulator